MMNRRAFLGALGLLAAPLGAEAQPGPTFQRIGVLTLSVAFSTPTFQAFQQGLRDLGYVEGQNIALELRFADGRPVRLADMAADLVRMKADRRHRHRKRPGGPGGQESHRDDSDRDSDPW